jgi:ABC-type transporter Mla MlaB component
MGFIVKKAQNVFQLKGSINSSTATEFVSFFKGILNTKNYLKINVAEVAEIDDKGIQLLEELHQYALKNNYTFSIEGVGLKQKYKLLS